MKQLLFVLCIACSTISYAQLQKQLYITTFSASGINDKDVKKTTATYSAATLSLRLSLMGGGNYTAGKTMDQAKKGEKPKQITITVTDAEKVPIYFKSPADFVSYMDERGYKATKHVTNKSGTDYTFKKK